MPKIIKGTAVRKNNKKKKNFSGKKIADRVLSFSNKIIVASYFAARKVWKKFRSLRRPIKIAIGVLVLAVAVLAVWAAIVHHKRSEMKEAPKPAASNNIIDKYKSQLPDLEKKAQSGKAGDLKNYAVAQYATGDAQGAADTYTKLIQSGAQAAVNYNNLANALRDQKKYDEAIKNYESAISKDKNLLSAYFNLGSVYQYNLGQIDKAIDVYKEGIQNNPKSADLEVFLGQAYEQMKDTANAKSAYEAALKLQSTNAAAKAALDRLAKTDTASSKDSAKGTSSSSVSSK